ncbi:pilus assembly protein PilE [Ahniella affigens]|uniref:Pilus assembly protein PilE n=1 Tax=Ahniella affigens TaxID=2021234 RepID=A0A2P1PMU5_9GAMM|nr:type IV pilin protein [Ahniella affigens]AVP96161.1 pilus assembly protein PilE [Ahniella affigens]
MKHSQYGFTLIELMVALIVMAILAGIAYPSYTQYTFRARRADGQNVLIRVAAEQERFYTQFNRYAQDLTAAPPAGLGMTSLDSDNGYYTVSVAAGPSGNNQSYTLRASPAGIQVDDACERLVLSSTGLKTQSGSETNGPCW